MNTTGTPTPRVFLVGPEAHKLTVEFIAHTAISEGQQVVLNIDGEIQAAAAATESYKILGTALKSAAADARVPVAVNAFYLVEAKAAADSQPAGPIQLGTYASGIVVAAVAGADEAAKSIKAIGFALDAATTTGDRVRALMYR